MPAPQPWHVDDFGGTLRANIVDQNREPVNITGCDVTFRLAKPSGVVVEKGASIVDGPTGLCQYVIESGVLDQAGTWTLQGIVVNGVISRFATLKPTFEVEGNL